MSFLTIVTGLLMGTIMGLLGGGGSILSVPIFIYLFKFPAIEATAFSLLVVGLSASLGAFKAYKQKNINIKDGLIFAVSSTLGVLISRGYLLNSFPDQLGPISKNDLIVYCFMGFLFIAGLKMILSSAKQKKVIKVNLVGVIARGFIIGILTGFIGAGGGFLIVPALNLVLGFPMKVAVGTSLFIISINSTLGFISSLSSIETLPLEFILVFTSASLCGVLIGQGLGKKIDNSQLKKFFGFFVLIMAFVMAYKEFT